ncbi:PQQ-binding-like beta-propeller repeat protein [Natronosalvus halobius]|uniref:PQQ-binding-like beta-propeller repeat protein n=1 Tax=Natronosalvus halobius TaxID=2953746 RepID=UPI00209DD5D6|nr:PQQ-binding-like beta-propeller repeat protein [Natronosalvus halobius]USZ70770.1 PQQ-like beta-propeller repeat protein [Natronosalvus halobius]
MAAGGTLVAGSVLATAGVTSEGMAEADLEEPTGWSSSGGNPGNARYLPVDGEFPEPERVAWEYDQGGDIAVVDGRVYVCTTVSEGLPEVHALDAADGSVQWVSEELPVDETPAVAGDTVYVGGEQLSALDAADGSVRWTREFEVDDPTVSSPTVIYGRVYTVANGTLYALDPADGSTDWKRETAEIPDEEEEPRPLETEPVAVAGEQVYAVTADKEKVAAFDAATGETAWTSSTGETIRGPATATEQAVYIRSHAGYESLAFDPETGETSKIKGWGPAAATGEIRASYDEMGVYVSHLERGWNDMRGTSREYGDGGSVTIIGDTLVVTTATIWGQGETAYGFDLEDGTRRWDVPSKEDGIDVYKVQAVDEETLYDYGRDLPQPGGDRIRALRPAETDEGDDDAGDDRDREDEGEDGDQNEDDNDESETDSGDGREDGSSGDDPDGGDGADDSVEDDAPDEDEVC